VATASFAEAIALPIALEFVLIPHMLANPGQIWRIARWALLGCLAGAAVGYGLGWLFYESLGLWAVETFGWQEAYQTAKTWIESYGFWAIVAIGLTPVPFQTAMLLAGAGGYPFLPFMAAAALSRGVRYFGLALLVRHAGPTVRRRLFRVRPSASRGT
jgi:membrane protein YqaA with SNARE-associated domain